MLVSEMFHNQNIEIQKINEKHDNFYEIYSQNQNNIKEILNSQENINNKINNAIDLFVLNYEECKKGSFNDNEYLQIETLKTEHKNMLNKLIEEKFIFSIIIPIYNTEKYLSQAIDSVLNQSFSFGNVEIILVDDGSSDSSSEICKRYVEKYPDNIKYIYQENQGLSASRNTGLKAAHGKFINFLDSDDKLEPQTLNEIFYHFNKFGNQIDIISMPRWRFDASEGWMSFYKKYDKSRIADIDGEYDFPITPVNSAFLRRSSALKFEFDTRLVLSEDNHFMTKLILEKGKFGVIDSAKYLYRKRPEENSLIDTKKTDKRYFTNGMEFHFKGLIKYSCEKFGKVLRYVQSDLMYDLQWFFLQNTEVGVLSDDELNKFHENLHEVFQVIDDDIILSQNFNKFIKSYMLNIKYAYPGYNINPGDGVISLNNGISFDKLSENKIVIENISENTLNGHFKFYSDEIIINAYDGEKKLDMKITNIEKEISISKVISYTFNFTINLDEFNGLDNFRFELEFNSKNYSISYVSKK